MSNTDPFASMSNGAFGFNNPAGYPPNNLMSMPTVAPEPVNSAVLKRRRRKRLKPGERRVQILQTLAHMLEERGSERVTTAQLAARLQISEAALYRHFASKTQMFEALLELVESYVNGLITEASQVQGTGSEKATQLVTRLLAFAEENPGLARILTGGALVYEHKRLLARMNALLAHFEAALYQCLQSSGTTEPALGAELLATFAFGRIHIWSRSDFTRSPTANLTPCLSRLVG